LNGRYISCLEIFGWADKLNSGFLSPEVLATCSWQYLERSIGRLLLSDGFSGVRLLGQSGDEGADILAHRNSKRWLVQVKQRRTMNIGIDVLDETVRAMHIYRADVPVIATNQAFTDQARSHQSTLMGSGILLQMWDRTTLAKRWEKLAHHPIQPRTPRPYQEDAIASIVRTWNQDKQHRSALVVMATGLGKTFVAAEAYRRICADTSVRVLVLGHTNELVYQLEKAFWPCLTKFAITSVWNGFESPDSRSDLTFACIDSVAAQVKQEGRLREEFDLVIVDECHHAGSDEYRRVLEALHWRTYLVC
jgi:hypothetical protein